MLLFLTVWHFGRMYERGQKEIITIAKCNEINQALECEGLQIEFEKNAQVYTELLEELQNPSSRADVYMRFQKFVDD